MVQTMPVENEPSRNWVAVKTAMQETGLKRSTIDSWIRCGKLDCRVEGRLKLVPLADVLERLADGAGAEEEEEDDDSTAPLRAMAAMARTAIGQNAELLRALPHAWNALGIEPALKMLNVAHSIIQEQREELEKLRAERREMFATLESAKSEESERTIAAAVASQELEQKAEIVSLLKREVPRVIAARAVDKNIGAMLAGLSEDQLSALALVLSPEQLEQVRLVAETQRVRFNAQTAGKEVTSGNEG